MANPHYQPAWELVPYTDVPTAIKSQLQQQGTHNPHKGHPWSTQFRLPRSGTATLPQAILPRLGDIADVPNILKKKTPQDEQKEAHTKMHHN